MKKQNSILASAVLAIGLLSGCVPAGETLAVVQNQERTAKSEYYQERRKGEELASTQQNLRARLSQVEGRRSAAVASGTPTSSTTVRSMDNEIASLRQRLAGL